MSLEAFCCWRPLDVHANVPLMIDTQDKSAVRCSSSKPAVGPAARGSAVTKGSQARAASESITEYQFWGGLVPSYQRTPISVQLVAYSLSHNRTSRRRGRKRTYSLVRNKHAHDVCAHHIGTRLPSGHSRAHHRFPSSLLPSKDLCRLPRFRAGESGDIGAVLISLCFA